MEHQRWFRIPCKCDWDSKMEFEIGALLFVQMQWVWWFVMGWFHSYCTLAGNNLDTFILAWLGRQKYKSVIYFTWSQHPVGLPWLYACEVFGARPIHVRCNTVDVMPLCNEWSSFGKLTEVLDFHSRLLQNSQSWSQIQVLEQAIDVCEAEEGP